MGIMGAEIKNLITNHDKGLDILDKVDFLCRIKCICIDNVKLYAVDFPALSKKYSRKIELCNYAIDKLLRKYADLMAVNNAHVMVEIIK